MRISDWSSDVCSSDLDGEEVLVVNGEGLTFEQTIAIDDQYLFTVTQRVVNNGGAAAAVAPFGLISRSGTPGTLDFRSEERRVGNERVSTCRSWWTPSH